MLGRRIVNEVWDPLAQLPHPEKSRRYWSDGTEELYETDRTGSTLRKYYTYGSTIDELCYVDNVTADADYYYHTNHQGTVYSITDENGVIVEAYQYDEYGNVKTTVTDPGDAIPPAAQPEWFDGNDTVTYGYGSVIGNTVLFQGRRYDDQTGTDKGHW